MDGGSSEVLQFVSFSTRGTMACAILFAAAGPRHPQQPVEKGVWNLAVRINLRFSHALRVPDTFFNRLLAARGRLCEPNRKPSHPFNRGMLPLLLHSVCIQYSVF